MECCFLAFQGFCLVRSVNLNVRHHLGQIELIGNRSLKKMVSQQEFKLHKPSASRFKVGKWIVKPAKDGDILMPLVLPRIGPPACVARGGLRAAPSCQLPGRGAGFRDPCYCPSLRSRVWFSSDEDFWSSRCPTQIMVTNGYIGPGSREDSVPGGRWVKGTHLTWWSGAIGRQPGWGSQATTSKLEIPALRPPSAPPWASHFMFSASFSLSAVVVTKRGMYLGAPLC